MDRSELVSTLELVYPAVADNNLVPSFTCFMFDGKTVRAYNDAIGIVATLEMGQPPFAVSGKVLLELLQNSKSDDVEFQVTDDNVIVKTGKSVVKLPYFKEFLFEEPKEKYLTLLDATEEVISGIETCLTTTSRDQSQTAIMGVCFNFDLKEVNLFSCDGDAITQVTIDPKVNHKGKHAYTVPNVFCDALLKIVKESGEFTGHLGFNEEWVSYWGTEGHIYGRMIVNDKPLDHRALVKLSMDEKQPFVPVPLGLSEALSRARVLADPESGRTSMTVTKGQLKLTTSTHMGDLTDEIKIKGHGDVNALVHASLVHRSLKVCESISIQDRVTAYRLGDTVLQIVSNIGV